MAENKGFSVPLRQPASYQIVALLRPISLNAEVYEMNMPGFTAEATLYEAGEHHNVAILAGGSLSEQEITPAFDLCDWFPSLPWCSKPPTPGGVYCWHTTTDTYCTGIVEWCKDNSICSDGSTRSSGWYACGVCFGWGW